MTSVRPRELFRDAYRNLGWLHVLIGAAAVLALVGATLLVLAQMSASLRQEVDLRRSAVAVWTAVLDEDSDIKAAGCMRLAGADGVHAAGGILQPERTLRVSAYPGGASVPVTRVTPGYVGVFVPQSPSTSVTVGPDLLSLGTVSVGQTLYDGALPIAQIDAVLPDWVPSQTLGSTVAVPGTGEHLLHECAVRMAPGAADAGAELLESQFGDTARISRFATPSTATDSPWAQWKSTLQWQPAVAAGGAVGLVAFVVHWARRSEYGLRRVFGSKRSEILALAAVESALTLLPAAVVSAVVVSLALLLRPHPIPDVALPLAVLTITAGTSVAWCAVSTTVLLAIRSRPWESLRDR